MGESNSDIKGEIRRYLGYKFFKSNDEDNNKIDIVRIIKTYSNNKDVMILFEDGTTVKKDIHFLVDYTALAPDALVLFNGVSIATGKNTYQNDVIVCAYKISDYDIGTKKYPYVVCRQSCTDFFYNLINPEKGYVGVSVSVDDCPTNVNYGSIMMCDRVDKGVCVNAYRNDTVDDVLSCINTKYFDNILTNLYNEHASSTKDPKVSLKSIDMGWCKSLKDLLKINNFDIDFEQMFGISIVDFKISDYLYQKDDEVQALTEEALIWLNYTYKISAVDTCVIKYDLDIDLSKFNNTNYIILRDSNNDLYLVDYVINGEYLESDLWKKYNQVDISTKFRMKVYDKFH